MSNDQMLRENNYCYSFQMVEENEVIKYEYCKTFDVDNFLFIISLARLLSIYNFYFKDLVFRYVQLI